MDGFYPLRLSLDAMATRFELLIYTSEPNRSRSAAEEALAEVEALDRHLSMYAPDSEISWINAHAADQPVRVGARLFGLLQLCADISSRTSGAFDITVAPLMRAWREAEGPPARDAQLCARDCVGMSGVVLDPDIRTVRFLRRGMRIDLGAIGKGYAIDRAVEVLREHGISRALLHGGTSTIYGLGSPPGSEIWRLALGPDPGPKVADLRDEALSVSASHGRYFDGAGGSFGHILDPRTGEPAPADAAVAVIGPDATLSDALSTAALVLGPDDTQLAREYPDYRVIWIHA